VTHFLKDILRQPGELQRTIDYLRGQDRSRLAEAVAVVQRSHRVYLTGVGSSWNVALRAGPLISQASCPVYLQDASKLLQFAAIPSGAVILVISRAERNIEIVRLPAKARECRGVVIGVTNSEDGALAQEAHTDCDRSQARSWNFGQHIFHVSCRNRCSGQRHRGYF
jgi:DNA-binding MurR/RpiR family transcriptional regulator